MKTSRVIALAMLLGLCHGTWAVAENQVRFTRHVVPLFSKLGCNSGSCHGMVQGKGGFRLSLIGAEPELDHQRLLKEHGGRRVSLLNPERIRSRRQTVQRRELCSNRLHADGH